MLTGLIPPTSGDAIIQGLRVSTDMQAIRGMLGVCPQHDILFPDLTVMQHLQMYATFKGVPASEVNAAATKMIAEVGLTEKASVKSSMLSGVSYTPHDCYYMCKIILMLLLLLLL
jgi:ATP-binding cassette subfamily A (ABC1) protein 3